MRHFKASSNEPRINIVSSFLFFLLGVLPYLFSTFLYFSTSVRNSYNALEAAYIIWEAVNIAYSLCVLKYSHNSICGKLMYYLCLCRLVGPHEHNID